MKRTGLLLVIAALATAGCEQGREVLAGVEVSGDVLVFNGPITTPAANRFLSLIDATPITRVRIVSGGGVVEPAIRMAEAIHRRGLDVEVAGPCFSSCANYIFPAGRRKIIGAAGIVGWHGNLQHLLYLHENGIRRAPEANLKGLERVAAMEERFYRSIGVDGRVCWFAKIAPYKVRNLYFLSPEDMARFGIRNVTVRADYAGTDLSPYRHGRVRDIEFVRVMK